MIKLNVEELLKQKNMSKETLCTKTNISRYNLNKAIKNHNSISYSYLERLCKALNCEINELLVFVADDGEVDKE